MVLETLHHFIKLGFNDGADGEEAAAVLPGAAPHTKVKSPDQENAPLVRNGSKRVAEEEDTQVLLELVSASTPLEILIDPLEAAVPSPTSRS